MQESMKETSGGSSAELQGLFLFGLFFFVTIALTSHAILLHFGAGKSIVDRNWLGVIGGYLSLFLYQMLGVAAWWAPAGIGFAAVSRLFSKRFVRSAAWIIPSWTAILVSSAGLSALFGEAGTAGGVCGLLVSDLLLKWVGHVGAFLVLFVAFLAGLVAGTPFSLFAAWNRVFSFASWLWSSVKAFFEFSGPVPAAAVEAAFRQAGELTGRGSPAADGIQQTGASDAVVQGHGGMSGEKNEPVIKKTVARQPVDAKAERSFEAEMRAYEGEFRLPPISFLNDPTYDEQETDKAQYLANARILEQKLLDFGVAGKVVEICPGPVVTMYEFAPAPGIKINKVASLTDDLALALKTQSVRIVAPIPGKGVIGIELANKHRQVVFLKELLASEAFKQHKGALPLAIGQDIVGHPVVADLAKMPHLLIAGATGTGKSVGLNAMILSLLYCQTPKTLRLLLIDPKRIELSLYEGIPHLLHPVVSAPKDATRALKWAVLEMERRYQLLEAAQARNLEGYNKTVEQPLPYLVIIIDELADLMMVSSKEVETSIARLAQMARAAGIHLLIATQRPSVDVLTGLIKANFSARISFKVSSKVDSRTILDVMGAERLLGMGDMLFLPPGTASLQRIHGAYVSEQEIGRVVEFWRQQGEPQYDPTVVEPGDEEDVNEEMGDIGDADEKYREAVRIVKETGQASISMLQRRLRVGYNRSARMIEQMERDGIVTPVDAMGRRQVLRD
jgi:S-DNA-T family DNA segregation ATPase FtsK/SpoIIIE